MAIGVKVVRIEGGWRRRCVIVGGWHCGLSQFGRRRKGGKGERCMARSGKLKSSFRQNVGRVEVAEKVGKRAVN